MDEELPSISNNNVSSVDEFFIPINTIHELETEAGSPISIYIPITVGGFVLILLIMVGICTRKMQEYDEKSMRNAQPVIYNPESDGLSSILGIRRGGNFFHNTQLDGYTRDYTRNGMPVQDYAKESSSGNKTPLKEELLRNPFLLPMSTPVGSVLHPAPPINVTIAELERADRERRKANEENKQKQTKPRFIDLVNSAMAAQKSQKINPAAGLIDAGLKRA